MNNMKECRRCHVLKPVTEYWKSSATSDRLQDYCKDCARKSSRESHRQKYRQLVIAKFTKQP